MVFDGWRIKWGEDIFINFDEKFFGTFYIHNKEWVIVQNYDGGFEKISIDGAISHKFSGYYNYLAPNIAFPLFYDKNTSSVYSALSDGKREETNWPENGYLIDDFYLTFNNANTAFYFLNADGTVLWEYETKDGLEFRQYAGRYKDILVFVFKNAKPFLFNFKNGEIEKIIDDGSICKTLLQDPKTPSKFYSLSNSEFNIFDVQKLSFTKKVDLQSSLPTAFRIVFTCLQDDKILCVIDEDMIGIFDYREAQFLEFFKLDFENSRTLISRADFCMLNNNVYVRDTDNKLHVLTPSDGIKITLDAASQKRRQIKSETSKLDSKSQKHTKTGFKWFVGFAFVLFLIFTLARTLKNTDSLRTQNSSSKIDAVVGKTAAPQSNTNDDRLRKYSLQDQIALLELRADMNAPNAFIITQNDLNYYTQLSTKDAAAFMSHYRSLVQSFESGSNSIKFKNNAQTIDIDSLETFDQWVANNLANLSGKEGYPQASQN